MVSEPGVSSTGAQDLTHTRACVRVPDLDQAPLEAHPYTPLAVHLHAGHCTAALEGLQLFRGCRREVMHKDLTAGNAPKKPPDLGGHSSV